MTQPTRHDGSSGLQRSSDRLASGTVSTDPSTTEVQRVVLAGRTKIDRRMPHGLDLSGFDFETYFVDELPEIDVRRLGNVSLRSADPIRIDGKVYDDYWASPISAEQWAKRRRRPQLRLRDALTLRRVRRKDPIVWVTDEWSRGYFHWMGEALCRLEMVAMTHDLSDVTLMLPAQYRRRPYVRQTLAAFSGLRYEFVPSMTQVDCDDVIFPSHAAYSGNFHPRVTGRLRDRLVDFVQQQASSVELDLGPNVYISRRDAPRRRIVNEPAVQPILDRYGFQTFVAERHDWVTQLSVLRQCQRLISCHGAGLTNMFVMNEQSRVMELRTRNIQTPNCYVALAGMLGIDLHVHATEPIKADSSVYLGDVRLDPAGFEQAVAGMMAD